MDYDVFVFGSNLAGRHGKGAALHAKNVYGAKYGIGFGWTSYNSYAIPTKDKNLQTLTLEEIRPFVCDFFDEAEFCKERVFCLTPIGCGLAGHSSVLVSNMVKDCKIPKNVLMHPSWLDHLENPHGIPYALTI